MRNHIKNLVLLVILFWVFASSLSYIYAYSSPSEDYTYIDCDNWNDTTWVAFDHEKPYLSLKQWIEKTIQYINNNWLTNAYWTGAQYMSFIFEIRVKWWCQYNWKDGNSITLSFNWVNNNSILSISWFQGSPIIENIYFQLGTSQAWNVEFNNFNFYKNDLTGYYFAWLKDSTQRNTYNSSLIKIKDSLINISTWKQFVNYNCSQCLEQVSQRGIGWVCIRYSTISPGWFSIENSRIDARINGNYNFMLPLHLKDNKINIINSNTDNNKFSVWFYRSWKSSDWYNYNSINIISNEIDMWWDNFTTNNENATFINNKFTNVGNLTIGTEVTSLKYNTFVNNQVESSSGVIITNNEVAYNNLFINWFTDTRDTNNYKSNYSSSVSSNTKWIGWLLRKNIWPNININTDYKVLYKEVTGNDLPYVENPLFIAVY
jgi:hypothetical protein